MSDEPTTEQQATDEHEEGEGPTRAEVEFVAALGRVLAHAESHGEVYTGAKSDLETVRAVYESLERSDDPRGGRA